MALSPYAAAMLEHEARSLLVRLARLKPFVLLEPMLPAAALPTAAQVAIERYLTLGRRELRALVQAFLGWLAGPGRRATAAEAQRRFTFLRLRFNVTLTQFDLFSDVVTQRSEHETGIWLSGLDLVAADALDIGERYYTAPPVVCYLDRGPGAAIRRARTRLPGGGDNPVAVVRVPRERMIGSGIASSLVHEVGHQGAALLDLVASLRRALRALHTGDDPVWPVWERWISEIVADFWAVARVGIASTLGLIAVVSLPRAFVFRLNLDDPHPMPWLRVKLSCAMGQALYPHPQWGRLAGLWDAFYPLAGGAPLPPRVAQLTTQLQASMPHLIALLVHHRPRRLLGRSLPEVLGCAQRHPRQLTALFRAWCRQPRAMYRAPPSLAFAVLGQARASALLTPQDESTLLGRLLNHWALGATLRTPDAGGASMARAALPLPHPITH